MPEPTLTTPYPIRQIAVIGGGMTGLSAAHRLLELQRERSLPLAITLFEAASEIGGLMGTREIDGYRIETGADSFITNKPWALQLCHRLGLSSRLIPTDARYRRSLILYRGRPVAVPEGFQLLAPISLGPVLRSPLLSWPGKLRLGAEYFLPPKRAAAGETLPDESLADFSRRRFGKEALERIIQPMVGGIYTSDPERLSMRATMSRFLDLEQKYGSVIRGLRTEQARQAADSDPTASGARYGLFVSLQNGISDLLSALRDQVTARGQVRTGQRIVGLERSANGAGWRLSIQTGTTQAGSAQPPQSAALESAEFDAVVIALPTHRAAPLIAPICPAAADKLRQFEYASTCIVVSGHKAADIAHPLDAFGLVIPKIEQRRILAVSFTHRKFPGRAPADRAILRTFVGGAMQPELARLPDAEIQQLVREELRDILGVRGEPEVVQVARWMDSMPQYTVGHVDRVAALRRDMEPLTTLALAGNAYDGVGIPDAVHSGEQNAERIVQQLFG